MLSITKEDVNTLMDLRVKLESILSNARIKLPDYAKNPANGCQDCGGCLGCKGGCEGCRGTSPCAEAFSFDDIKKTVENLEKLGPIVFSKDLFAELIHRK